MTAPKAGSGPGGVLDAAWAKPALLCAALLAALLLSAKHTDLRWGPAALPVEVACRQPASGALIVPRRPAVPPSHPTSYRPPKPKPWLDVDASVLLHRDFLLEGHELERAVSLGDSRRLRRHVARLMDGEHVRVTAVGASVTSGAGGREWDNTRTNWPGYVPQFADWLEAAFPLANASVANAGMAGTFGGVFSQCFDTLVPEADIYILEQTTFDGTEPDRCYCKDHYVDTPNQLAIERLIRRMLKQPHQPAVIMLNTYGFRFPNREVYQRSVENQVQVMAQFYGLPTASLRAAAWGKMLAGADGFDVSTSVKLYGDKPVPQGRYPLYFDQVHPWGPTGHRALAELLIRAIQATAAGLSIQPLVASELDMPQEPLLPPLRPGNYETNTSSCWLGDDFHKLVDTTDSLQGFQWINERPNATAEKAQKWGYVAQEAGSFLEFAFDSRVPGSPSWTNRVVLSYLASYSGMGVARVACMRGCKCEETEVDAHWKETASVLMVAEFAATQHPRCRVRVTVQPRSSSGGGHKFKLTGVMLLPAGTNEFSSTDRLEVVVPQMFEGKGS